MPAAARRLGLIGCGRIGAPVLRAWRDGALPGWQLAAVLARQARASDGIAVTDDAEAFFSTPFDLVVDCAGPHALAAHGERALAHAELWTVGAAALADAALAQRLQAAADGSGHRLRLLHGAFAGLDGVAAAAVDPAATLELDIDLPPGDAPAGLVFSGSVRDAARRFPDALNVAVAAAWAGPGLDATTIRVHAPGPTPPHRLALRARSRGGMLTLAVQPQLSPGQHPVADAIVAALRQALRPVWAG
ncbi:MAG: aspartate dehydrogenase domain-containing protein [Rubrivivax sp.]